MKKTNQLLQKGIYVLEKGKGSLKHYKYWTGGVVLRNKETIAEAIELKLRILRQDKITNKIEVFDYKTNNFRSIKV